MLQSDVANTLKIYLEDQSLGPFNVCNNYKFYYYNCDDFQDVGWGCGYRSLQTILSFYTENVPSILELQKKLVEIEDKPGSFYRSREWIGSVEISMLVDVFADHCCKIKHYPIHDLDRVLKMKNDLSKHFLLDQNESKDTLSKVPVAPVMIGGHTHDNRAKTCVGFDGENMLILDPHYYGQDKLVLSNLEKGQIPGDLVYVLAVKDLNKDSFYNFCFPF